MAKKNEKVAVVVTTLHRGVFFGYTSEELTQKILRLTNARNCLYWPSSIGGFVGLASSGPNAETKIGPACEMVLQDITAVLVCSKQAEEAWVKARWQF